MTTEAEPVRPEDLKPGDRVRVTFEGVLDEDGDLELPKGGCIARYVFRDATITRLPPPVDPDLLLARKVWADRVRGGGFPELAIDVEAGLLDGDGPVQVALAAIKAAKEQSK